MQYAARKQLLGESEKSLSPLRKAALQAPYIQSLLKDIGALYTTLVTAHKNFTMPLHKLLLLLDLGFDATVPEIAAAKKALLAHQDPNGVPNVPTNTPVQYGGTGEDSLSWALCDGPLSLLAAALAGAEYETDLKQGVTYLAGLLRPNGFPCAVSQGTWRGPGKKADSCPYASLCMLRLFAVLPQWRESEAAKTAAESILWLWENSWEQHPYMFFMGTDFRKLKAPPVWYDLVAVADTLGKFPFVRQDPRYLEMLQIIADKQGSDGLFTPEAVYQGAKGQDFGQKKTPSMYLTFLCLRALGRQQPTKAKK